MKSSEKGTQLQEKLERSFRRRKTGGKKVKNQNYKVQERVGEWMGVGLEGGGWAEKFKPLLSSSSFLKNIF